MNTGLTVVWAAFAALLSTLAAIAIWSRLVSTPTTVSTIKKADTAMTALFNGVFGQ